MSPRTGAGPERGQATVLIVGLAVVLLMAIGVVIDASAAYLQRQGLSNVADGAALAAADAGSRNEGSLYVGGLGIRDRLEQRRATARAAVADHLARTGVHRDYPGLTWTVGLDDGGTSVVVRVRAPLALPITVPGSPERASIGASAAAVVRLDD